MDYTQSSGFAIDAGTTNRMHLQAQAVPTAVSDNDMNMVIWEAMEIVKAAGLAGAPFDKAVPATYQKLLTALRSAGVFATPPALDNTTKAATTAFVRSELLSLGNAAYAAIFGASRAANGYQRLPGGLVFQWGQILTAFAGVTAGTYPIAFPNAALFVSGSGIDQVNVNIIQAVEVNASTFNISSWNDAGARTGTTVKFHAIGF